MTIALPSRRIFRSSWERMLGETESPIEALWLEAFCPLAVTHGYVIGRVARRANETIVIKPQAWIDQVRVDFLVSFAFFGSHLGIVVETDGHDFHERTKAQARKDRSRDRALQSLGFEVFRFTGSEITAAPGTCAGEVLNRIMDFQTAAVVKAMEAD